MLKVIPAETSMLCTVTCTSKLHAIPGSSWGWHVRGQGLGSETTSRPRPDILEVKPRSSTYYSSIRMSWRFAKNTYCKKMKLEVGSGENQFWQHRAKSQFHNLLETIDRWVKDRFSRGQDQNISRPKPTDFVLKLFSMMRRVLEDSIPDVMRWCVMECSGAAKFCCQWTYHLELSAACTTSTRAVTECFHACTEDAPILHHPAPLRHLCVIPAPNTNTRTYLLTQCCSTCWFCRLTVTDV